MSITIQVTPNVRRISLGLFNDKFSVRSSSLFGPTQYEYIDIAGLLFPSILALNVQFINYDGTLVRQHQAFVNMTVYFENAGIGGWAGWITSRRDRGHRQCTIIDDVLHRFRVRHMIDMEEFNQHWDSDVESSMSDFEGGSDLDSDNDDYDERNGRTEQPGSMDEDIHLDEVRRFARNLTRVPPKEAKKHDCPICLEPLADPDLKREVGVVLECHPTHFFHRACIREWMVDNPTCPICRTEVDGCARRAPKPAEELDWGEMVTVPMMQFSLRGGAGGEPLLEPLDL